MYDMARSLRLGITGPMGSGKSTFSDFLRAAGHLVLESDAMAKEIMQHDPHARQEISALLGKEAYHGHELNKEFVASSIFTDRAKRVALESIVHPRVTSAMRQAFAHGVPDQVSALESALILQTELWREFDYIVLIEASDETIITRLRSSRFTEEDVRARLSEQRQMTSEIEEADFTIENNGSLEEFKKRSQFILELMPHLAGRDLPEAPLHQLELDDEEPSLN